ncbi:MAG: hypothetical protein ABFR32_03955 [Bacteroidota bacterium]
MKNLNNTLFILLLAINVSFSQTIDSTGLDIKKGWSFGVLPAITYNSDLGFQYGGVIDLYNYGKGDIYPKYYERYFLEISRFTKGSGKYNFSYETNKLIRGKTIYFDIKYEPDEQYDFLGGNGYESVINADWENREHTSYKSKMFYKNQTKRLKVKFDLLNPINKTWSWMIGLEYYNYDVNSVDVDKYNNGRKDDEKIRPIDEMPGLWDRYVKWGVIDSDNANGGSFLGFKVGAMFDTRDNWTNATKGIWTEAVLVWVPQFIGNTSTSYLKLNLTHRQFFTVIKDKLTFAYRLGYTGNITGNEPYFGLPIMYNVTLKGSSNEGLGGQRTLRGIRRNRVVGNGEVYGNGEFRYKFLKFRWVKQNWYLSLNAFLDAGRVVQLLPLEDQVHSINETTPLNDYNLWGQYAIGYDADGNPNSDTIDDYFNFGAEKTHYSYGVGFRIALNENFVVGLDYGRTFNNQDGISGMYIGLNYIF